MAKCEYIADSAHDPQPLWMNHAPSAATLPVAGSGSTRIALPANSSFRN